MKKDTKPKGYVFGRPTKYDESLGDKVIALMAEGKFIAQVCADLMISRDTFYEYCKVYPYFSDSYKVGQILSEDYWIKYGLANLITDKETNFNNRMYDRIMRTQFRDGWSDNHDYLENNILNDYAKSSLKEQIDVLDRALTERQLSLKQYNTLIDSIKVKSDIISTAEIEERIKQIELVINER